MRKPNHSPADFPTTTCDSVARNPDLWPLTRRQQVADLALLLVTILWGGTFVMVKDAVAQYPVLPFLAVRFSMAAIVLAPAAWFGHRSQRLADLLAGIVPGALLFAGYALQTFGLQETEVSKVGFITGLSVVLVPLFVAVLWRRWPPLRALVGSGLAVLGLALLSLHADLSIRRGDLLLLGGAVAFAGHITSLGVFSPGRDPRLLTAVQIATVALLSTVLALWQGGLPPVPSAVWPAVAFTAVMATAVTCLVQTTAQRFTTATHAALIFAAEPVFAAIFGVTLAGERLLARGWLGCAAILAGVILGALAQTTE